MSVASSLGTSSSFGMTFASCQVQAFLDDIRLEEGDVDLPMISFLQIQVNEIVTEGSFKYYHGYVVAKDNEATENNYVALKCLKGQDAKRGLKWINETKILANLKHDNIRNIHAESPSSLSDSLENNNHELGIANRYFLVMDPIQETLRRRMEEWKSNENDSSFASSLGGKRNSVSGVNRFNALGRVKFVGQDVITAMTYLYSKNISFGKLTPSKIGFDNHGTIKLMDFSEASIAGDNEERRFASDIYSFGLLLWELFTLTSPKEQRPPLRGVIHSEILREFLEQCWDRDIQKRPTFSKRLAKRMMEITSACRHNLVATNKREVGEEYMLQHPEKASSLRNLLSPKSQKKSFRVSRVDLTLDVFSRRSTLSGSKVAWDSSTVVTSTSEISS
jgi:hypothetical protein